MTGETEENITLSETSITQFNVGDRIKVNKVEKENHHLDSEDYFYLKTFENNLGIISEKNKNRKGIYSYRVEFSGEKFGYFYEKDFTLVESKEANNV